MRASIAVLNLVAMDAVHTHQTKVLISSLPTTEPLVTGSLWLSGSGAGNATGSAYLMVFNG